MNIFTNCFHFQKLIMFANLKLCFWAQLSRLHLFGWNKSLEVQKYAHIKWNRMTLNSAQDEGTCCHLLRSENPDTYPYQLVTQILKICEKYQMVDVLMTMMMVIRYLMKIWDALVQSRMVCMCSEHLDQLECRQIYQSIDDRLINQSIWINQSINQSINQINQSINQSITQDWSIVWFNQPSNWTIKLSIK